MGDIPPEQRPGSGLTRRGLLERSAALGVAISVPGFLGAAAADASTAVSKPNRGGHLRVGMNDGGAGDSLAPWNIPIYSAAARAEQVYERLYKYDAHAFPRPRLAESVTSNRQGDDLAAEAPQGRDLPQRQAADGGRRPLLAALHRRSQEQGGVARAARADRPQGLAQGLAHGDRVSSQEPDRRLPGPPGGEGRLDRARRQDRLRAEAGRDGPLQVLRLAARRPGQLRPQRQLLGARAGTRPVGRLAGDPLHPRRHRARQCADRQAGRRDRVHAVRAGEGAQRRLGDSDPACGATPDQPVLRADGSQAVHRQQRPACAQVRRRPGGDGLQGRARLRLGRQRPLRQGIPVLQQQPPAAQVRPRASEGVAQEGGLRHVPVQPADVERVARDARVRDGVQGAGQGGRHPGHSWRSSTQAPTSRTTST